MWKRTLRSYFENKQSEKCWVNSMYISYKSFCYLNFFQQERRKDNNEIVWEKDSCLISRKWRTNEGMSWRNNSVTQWNFHSNRPLYMKIRIWYVTMKIRQFTEEFMTELSQTMNSKSHMRLSKNASDETFQQTPCYAFTSSSEKKACKEVRKRFFIQYGRFFQVVCVTENCVGIRITSNNTWVVICTEHANKHPKDRMRSYLNS